MVRMPGSLDKMNHTVMMTLPRSIFLAMLQLAAVMFLIANPAHAGGKFSGATGFKVVNEGKSVSITVDAITNSSRENATGTLIVRLMALDSPYVGNSTNGKLLASFKLDGLNPGRQYPELKKVVAYNTPSVTKKYHVCLMLMEYRGDGYVVADYRNMPNTQLLGPPKMFSLTGPFKWKASPEGGTIDIEIGKISHHRAGATGSLKLSVWATEERFKGGTIEGFKLGSVTKAALKPDSSYSDVKNTAKYTPPPDGTYFITIVLSEYGGDETYSIVDFHTMSEPWTFKTPKPKEETDEPSE